MWKFPIEPWFWVNWIIFHVHLNLAINHYSQGSVAVRSWSNLPRSYAKYPTDPGLLQILIPFHQATSVDSSRCGYGSIPIDTFLVGWTSIYQLFWGSLGTRVLTHPHVTFFCDPAVVSQCQRTQSFWTQTVINSFTNFTNFTNHSP